MFYRLCCLFILVLCSQNSIKAQDLIHKKDELIIAARIIKVDSIQVHYLEYTNLKGDTLTISKRAVSHIRFDYESKANHHRNFKQTLFSKHSKNALSFGLLGTGGLLSFNYDRVLLELPNLFVSGKIGIGSVIAQSNLNLHLTGNTNFGKGMHYFEFGIGAAVALNRRNTNLPPNPGPGLASTYYNYYLSAPILGYRIQPENGLFFRVYCSAFFMFEGQFGENAAIPMIGLDLGYAF